MAENDPLERFVRDNREEFDREGPSSNVWESINQQLKEEQLVEEPTAERGKVIPLKRWMSYAAAAVVVFGVTWFAWPSPGESVQTIAETVQPQENIDGYSLADVSGEMAEVEEYYVTSVNDRMKQLQELDVDPELLSEIEILDQEYHSLQEEMGASVNSDKIIEAMIDNYRLRLDLLESMLEAFKEEKTQEDSKNEKDTTLQFI